MQLDKTHQENSTGKHAHLQALRVFRARAAANSLCTCRRKGVKTRQEIQKTTNDKLKTHCNEAAILDLVYFTWCLDTHAHTDRGSEPLESFHLEDLTADVPVAFRVLLWPWIDTNTHTYSIELYQGLKCIILISLQRNKVSCRALVLSTLPPGIPTEELQPTNTSASQLVVLTHWQFF